MSKSLTILIAVIAGVLLGTMVFKPSVTAVIKAQVPETVEEWIDFYAEEYQADATELKQVAFCESGYRTQVYGDHGKAYSVFQFHKETFDRWATQMGETLDYYNFQHQIKVAAWAFSQGESYKDDWTCWSKMNHR